MRSTLEDALVIYKQELEALLWLVLPAILLGPILAMVAASGLTLALAALPAFLALFGLCYAASVRGAGMLLNSRDPTPGAVYRGVLAKAIDVASAGAPLALLAGGLAASALVAGEQGYPLLAPAFAGLGVATALVWASRHAIDLPLILVYGLRAHDALHVGNVIARGRDSAALPLLLIVSAPLAPLVALGVGSGLWLSPIVGAGIFVIALALWLPFAAVAVAVHTSRLVDATEPAA